MYWNRKKKIWPCPSKGGSGYPARYPDPKRQGFRQHLLSLTGKRRTVQSHLEISNLVKEMESLK